MAKGHFIILERDGFQCFYCGATPQIDGVRLAVDHVIPVDDGGTDVAGNLVACCENCNSQKSNRVLLDTDRLLLLVSERNERHGISNWAGIDLGSSSALKRSGQRWETIRSMVELLHSCLAKPKLHDTDIWMIYAIAIKALPEYKRSTGDRESAESASALLTEMMRRAFDPPGNIFTPEYKEEYFRWFMSI